MTSYEYHYQVYVKHCLTVNPTLIQTSLLSHLEPVALALLHYVLLVRQTTCTDRAKVCLQALSIAPRTINPR